MPQIKVNYPVPSQAPPGENERALQPIAASHARMLGFPDIPSPYFAFVPTQLNDNTDEEIDANVGVISFPRRWGAANYPFTIPPKTVALGSDFSSLLTVDDLLALKSSIGSSLVDADIFCADALSFGPQPVPFESTTFGSFLHGFSPPLSGGGPFDPGSPPPNVSYQYSAFNVDYEKWHGREVFHCLAYAPASSTLVVAPTNGSATIRGVLPSFSDGPLFLAYAYQFRAIYDGLRYVYSTLDFATKILTEQIAEYTNRFEALTTSQVFSSSGGCFVWVDYDVEVSDIVDEDVDDIYRIIDDFVPALEAAVATAKATVQTLVESAGFSFFSVSGDLDDPSVASAAIRAIYESEISNFYSL